MARIDILPKAGAALLAAFCLAACADANVQVDLTSQSTARATTIAVLNADIYALERMNAARPADDKRKAQPFCPQGTLQETASGGATCTLVESGRFSTLTFGSRDPLLQFSPVAPDKVRVSLRMSTLKRYLENLGSAQGGTMLAAFLAGHRLTLTFSGTAVTDTNMTVSPDGKAAEAEVSFSDVLAGADELPPVFYAIVETPGS